MPAIPVDLSTAKRPVHCDWCCREFRKEYDEAMMLDGLMMHSASVNGSYSCLDSYRLYCKYIREDNLEALQKLIRDRPHTHPG